MKRSQEVDNRDFSAYKNEGDWWSGYWDWLSRLNWTNKEKLGIGEFDGFMYSKGLRIKGCHPNY